MPRVLIIDDDEAMNRALAYAVERKGYDVTGVLTLREGLEKALSGVFDVVYLDVHMPDGNGLVVVDCAALPEALVETIVRGCFRFACCRSSAGRPAGSFGHLFLE